MRNAFVAALYELAKKDPAVMLLVADNGAIVFDKFRNDCPKQFINCGICESNMVTVAAGLANCGRIPFVYTITPFLIMRAFEQVRNDVCMQNMNVKLVGIGGGLRYSTLGSTHHAIEDIAIMKVLPHMTIISPADPMETGKATQAIKDIPGPVYLRMGTTKEPRIYAEDYEFVPGKGIILKDGKDITLIGTGSILHEALQAAALLDRQGISARVLNIHTVKPLDTEIIKTAALETKAIITVEEHNIIGGLGESIAAVILEENVPVKFARLGLRDRFCSGYGSHEYLKQKCGLSAADIARTAKALL